MIHRVHLPRETRMRLSEIVRVQMDLLLAASQYTGGIEEETFSEYLNDISNRHERNQKLITWLLHTTSKPGEYLQTFINGTDGEELLEDPENLQVEKIRIVKMMRRDIGRLYTQDCEETFEFYLKDSRLSEELPATNQYLSENNVPDWLQAAKEFCIYFYENLSDDGLDGSLFFANIRYNRDAFFYEFEQANPDQYVCAICDEHDFMTILRGKYHSDIEHYFPKARYPHLACHPGNLIPICSSCNTAHRNKDPMEKEDGPRRSLSSIFLPYRDGSVQEFGAIRFSWTLTDNQDRRLENATPYRLELYIQKRNQLDQGFERKLQAFDDIYDIPKRWKERIDQIGDQMWRYLHHFLMAEFPNDEGFANPAYVKFKMNQLMTYLFEDLGKSPWTFVILWWLGNIIVEEIENSLETGEMSSSSPFLQTIQDMVEINAKLREVNQEKADEILDVIREFDLGKRVPNG